MKKKIVVKPEQGKLMVYSSTATMVTCKEGDRENIITITFVAPIATSPLQVMISINKHRFSHDIILHTGNFVINMPGPDLAFETQYCGRRSGSQYDKFKEMKLTSIPAQKVDSPLIEECWGHVECKVIGTYDAGSHTVFFGEIVAASCTEGAFDLERNRVNLGEGEEYTQILQFLGGRTYGILERFVEVPLDREPGEEG